MMQELTAVFESWHIGDGNYPPFHQGMLVNLAFMLEPLYISPAGRSHGLAFNHHGNAEYDFCGDVIRKYASSAASKSILGIPLPISKKNMSPPLAIIDTGEFKFYIESREVNQFKPEMRIQGRGTLLLDYYRWAEYLDRRVDPPDIFYTLEVSRLRRVQIPERFIHRHERGKVYPTRVPVAECEHIEDIETMSGQKFDEEFYLVDFSSSDRKDIPRTFII